MHLHVASCGFLVLMQGADARCWCKVLMQGVDA